MHAFELHAMALRSCKRAPGGNQASSAVISANYGIHHFAESCPPAAACIACSGGSVDEDCCATHQGGFAAGHLAACKGHTEVLACLLDRGVHPGATTLDGWTLLHEAAAGDHGASRFSDPASGDYQKITC